MCGCGGSTGTQTVTQESKNRPWGVQGAYLQPGFAWAADVAQDPAQQVYHGMTPTAQAGYAQMASNARDPNSALNQTIGGLRDTVGGNFLSTGNPYFQQAYGAAVDPMIRNFNEQIAPGIDATFSGAGRYGSGLYAQNRNSAEATLAKGLGDVSAQMGYQNYADERNRMLQASALLPQIAGQPAQDLVTAGNAEQANAQAGQQFSWDQLMRYMSVIGGQQWGGSSTTTSQQPTYSSPLGQGLGTIAAIGSLFAPK